MCRLWDRLVIGRRASVAIEFSLIAPFLLVLAGAIFELGSLMQANTAVNRLAMQYANSYADCSDIASGACQTELNQYVTTAALANIAPQLMVANLNLQMAQVQMNGSAATVEYSYPAGLSLSAAQLAAMQAEVPSGETGVVVTATYTYTLLLFSGFVSSVIGSSFNLSYTVAQLK